MRINILYGESEQGGLWLMGYQVVCRILLQKRLAVLGWGMEPIVVVSFTQDDHHPFLIIWLVKLTHERVVVGIDSQHRVAMNHCARSVRPGRP